VLDRIACVKHNHPISKTVLLMSHCVLCYVMAKIVWKLYFYQLSTLISTY